VHCFSVEKLRIKADNLAKKENAGSITAGT
jgi:hypothetical protein